MRILVIGGTAFMGPHVVRELHAEGHQVWVFNRNRTASQMPDGVQRITGDRQQLEMYTQQLRDLAPDVVLDMVLYTEDQAHTLMEVFTGFAGCVVVASSGDVYRAYGVMIGREGGSVEAMPLSERSALRTNIYPYRGAEPRPPDDPRRWLDDYDKIPIEQIILSNPGFAGTVLRLPMVHGPGDRQHRVREYLRPMDDGRPAILLDRGMADWRVTRGYVENVAHAISLAVTHDQATGGIYNIGDQDNLATRAWVQAIASCAGWRGEIHILPREDLPEHLHPGFNTLQDLVLDTRRIRSELGYEETVSLELGLQRTIAWERANPMKDPSNVAKGYAAEDELLKRLSA